MLAEGLLSAMANKGQGGRQRQLAGDVPGRYENTTAQSACAENHVAIQGPARPSRQDPRRPGPAVAAENAEGGYTNYLGQNLNVRPYAITLYPFCAQVQ